MRPARSGPAGTRAWSCPAGSTRGSGEVLRLAREALWRDGHVGVRSTRPSRGTHPCPRCRVRVLARLVEAEVERVTRRDHGRGDGHVGLVEAVLHTDRGGPGRDVEGEHHEAARLLGAELSGDDLRRPDLPSRACPGRRSGTDSGGGLRDARRVAEEQDRAQRSRRARVEAPPHPRRVYGPGTTNVPNVTHPPGNGPMLCLRPGR